MKFVKVPVSLLLLLPFVSLPGCAAGSSAGLLSMHETMSLSANHGLKDTSKSQTRKVVVSTAEPVARHVAHNQPQQQINQNNPVQAAYIQTAHRVVDSQPTASLITLGTNDDLYSIINNASGVVLIDYYADWCAPCRRQGGILHDMESSAHQNGALIVKVNVDQHPNLASKFRVSSLPTLMLVKNGQIVERQTGIADHQKIASYLRR